MKFKENDIVKYLNKSNKAPLFKNLVGTVSPVKNAHLIYDVYFRVPNIVPQNKMKNTMFSVPRGEDVRVYHLVANEEDLEAVSPNTDMENTNLITLNARKENINTKYADYIENQFAQKTNTQSTQIDTNKSKQDINIGSRVIINGKDDKITYDNALGIVKRIKDDEYFIEIQEDDSKNISKYYASVPLALLTLVEKDKNKFEIGDKVVCVDNANVFYKKTGEIVNRWDEDNSYMVKFAEDEAWMEFKDIKYPEDAAFTDKKKIGFDIPNKTTTIAPKQTKIEIEEEEEEEPLSKQVKRNVVPFKKEDLLELSYKDFFPNQDKITTIDDIKKLKAKFQSEMSQNISKLKNMFAEKAYHSADIVESYFNFLLNKVAKDLPVYRINDVIDDTDLLSTKTKVRASDAKELLNQYTLDQGIVAYWKFNDAVVFKTL